MLPPGDLRMALAALAGDDPEHGRWAELLQHRLGGTGVLAGHPVGNLMLTALLEREKTRSPRWPRLAELVGAVGRVLPMSPVPLDLVGEADRFDPDDPDRTRAASAASRRSLRRRDGCCRCGCCPPARRPAPRPSTRCARPTSSCSGPGSWFTSVIPHLLLRELGTALRPRRRRVVVVLNLVPQAGETDDYAPHELLRLLMTHARPRGGLPIHTVLADTDSVLDPEELRRLRARDRRASRSV